MFKSTSGDPPERDHWRLTNQSPRGLTWRTRHWNFQGPELGMLPILLLRAGNVMCSSFFPNSPPGENLQIGNIDYSIYIYYRRLLLSLYILYHYLTIHYIYIIIFHILLSAFYDLMDPCFSILAHWRCRSCSDTTGSWRPVGSTALSCLWVSRDGRTLPSNQRIQKDHYNVVVAGTCSWNFSNLKFVSTP